jgi:long-chain acyl-CoA synthetase
LPWRRLRHLYWAGDVLRFFSNPFARVFSRAMHLFPVDSRHPAAALEIANRVLSAGNVPVWFPEGWRSPDGNLQRFLPGIGQLLTRSGAPAVPAYIAGAFEALPRGRRIPKFHRISVTFGRPQGVASLRENGIGQTEEERIANGLRESVIALGVAAGGITGPSLMPDPPVYPVDSIRQ